MPSQILLVPKAAKDDMLMLQWELGHSHHDLATALIKLHPRAAKVEDELISALEGNEVVITYYAGDKWMIVGPLYPSTSGNQHHAILMKQLEHLTSLITHTHLQMEQINTRLAAIETNTSVERWTERWTEALPMVSNAVIAHIKPFIAKLLANPLSTIVVDMMDQQRSAVVP